jgi:frataxin-like iron-binding protein CyaY
MTEQVTEQAFASLADSLLQSLEEAIGAEGDAELQGGVLTVKATPAPGSSINMHPPGKSG